MYYVYEKVVMHISDSLRLELMTDVTAPLLWQMNGKY
jgi:hypothetical protein